MRWSREQVEKAAADVCCGAGAFSATLRRPESVRERNAIMIAAAGWTHQFAGLGALESATREALEAAGRVVQLPRGSQIFAPGQPPLNYLLLLSGDIRVSQMSESGRELVLYRVQPGESCALTTVCLLGGDDYQAEAIAETGIEAVVLPRAAFDDLIVGSPAFRQFVFAAFSARITDLFKLVDEIAFQRIDVRLAHKLIERSAHGGALLITHQQLASELGTAREVVSRQLHEFQRRGWIVSVRGSLTLIDRAAIERLAADG